MKSKIHIKLLAAAFAVFTLILVAIPRVYATNSPFVDILPDFWAYDSILETYNDGVMMGTGTDENGNKVFSPSGKLNMNQFFTVLTRAFYNEEVLNCPVAGAWPNQNFAVAQEHNLFNGIASWLGDTEVTREVMAQMMYNVMIDKGIVLPNDSEIQMTISKIPDFATVDSSYGTAVAVCYYLDLLSGVESQKDLRVHAQQRMIRQDVDALFEASRKGEWRIGQMYIRRQLIGVTFPGLSGLCIYLFAGIKAFLGQISIGNVVSYTASIIQLARSASRFAGCVGRMKSVADYSRDYMQYRNLEKRKRQGTIPVEKRRDGRFQIDFEHVSFRYPGTEEYVISDLTLSFEIGEKMAIVGPNGSGKTTFIKLLCRLYDVTEGCIKLNGIDIRKYDYQEYCALLQWSFRTFVFLLFPWEKTLRQQALWKRRRQRTPL